MDEPVVPPPPFNGNSIIGFVIAILTVVSFCISLAPFPFSTVICAPISFITGISALVIGLKSLRQIRRFGERGRTLALISSWAGGVIVFATLCVIVMGILLFPYFANHIKIPGINW